MDRAIMLTLAAVAIACPAECGTPMDLSKESDWQFRLVHPDGPGRWQPTLEEALRSHAVPEPSVRWPRGWRTFVPWQPREDVPPDDSPAQLRTAPAALSLGGISACRATLPLYTGGVLDLTVGHGAPEAGRWAWVFGEFDVPAEEKVTLSVTAPARATVWVDGQLTINAERPGEHHAPLSLAEGRHIVSARVYSGAEQWFIQGRFLPHGQQPVVEARCRFEVLSPEQFASVTIEGKSPDGVQLNGRPVDRPLPRMHSDQLLGISPSRLRKGSNVLVRSLSLTNARRLLANGDSGRLEVLGLRAHDVGIAMGPVVAVGEGQTVRIAIAANAEVAATLVIDERNFTSPTGVFHHWILNDLKPSTDYAYHVTVGKGQTHHATMRTLPAPNRPITVAVAGDPQSGGAWPAVAAAMERTRPDLVIIAGDLVVDGLVETQWHDTFLKPAANLLACVPCRVVPGNHDRYSPLLKELFGHEGARCHWSQRTGGALLIGIDGGADFSPGSDAAGWLERTLTRDTPSLAFVIGHYPAYSSRNHGKLADDRRVLEWTSRTAREHVVPILLRHRVTALFAGHDHGYERSELPQGLSAIVTGGAGAGTYPKRSNPREQNPYSKVFATQHHYSLLRVEPEAASLRVLTPDGKQLDERTWSLEPIGSTKENQP